MRAKQAVPAEKFMGAFSVVASEAITRAEVNRAILRSPDELALDFILDDLRHTVVLHRRAGSEFAGRYEIVKAGSGSTEGELSCQLFRDGERLFLFGRFPLDGEVFVWWAFLDSVDRFPDERPSPNYRSVSSPENSAKEHPRRRRHP